MKKLALALILAVACVPFLIALPGEGFGYYEDTYICNYHCPDQTSHSMDITICKDGSFNHCFRQKCPAVANMC